MKRIILALAALIWLAAPALAFGPQGTPPCTTVCKISTSLAIGGATIGSNALAVTGPATISGQLSGNIVVSSSATGGFAISGNGTNYGIIGALAGGHLFGLGDSGTTGLGTSVLMWSDNGAVGSPSGMTTANNETVTGSLTNSGITADTGHTDSSVCQDTTTHQFYSGTGTVGICLGTSSLRFKRDIRPAKEGLAQVVALNTDHFRYKDGHGDDGAREQIGFMAEDVVHVLPSLVGKDADGNPNSVDILGMVPVLVNAVKEQQAQIDELRHANDNSIWHRVGLALGLEK